MKDQTVKVAVAITERLFQDGIGHGLVGHGWAWSARSLVS